MTIPIDIIPSTLGGIQGKAWRIKKLKKISYSEAVKLVSIEAGFQNYAHARNHFESQKKLEPPRYKVYISAYWRNDFFESGRETLEVMLDKPLRELVTPHEMAKIRGLTKFKYFGPDQIITRITALEQKYARDYACYAARQLQFINATNLKPGKDFNAYPEKSPLNAVPLHDHSSTWQDEEGRNLFLDEPYSIEIDDPQRMAWAIKFNQRIEQSPWHSMYFPGGSTAFLITHKNDGVPLDPLLEKLRKLPTPDTEENWRGLSAPFRPVFVSPGKVEAYKPRLVDKDSPKKLQTKRNSERYVSSFRGYQSKPIGSMPINIHKEVGNRLVMVLADAYYRDGVTNRLDFVRSTLEDWLNHEDRPRKLTNEEFFAVYYPKFNKHPPANLSFTLVRSRIKDLNFVKVKLLKHYPESKPLRVIIRKLDLAIKSLNNWKGD